MARPKAVVPILLMAVGLLLTRTPPAQSFGNCNPGWWPGCVGSLDLCIPTTAMCCDEYGTYCPNGSVCWYPPGGIICCDGGYYGTMDGRCLPVGSLGRAAPARGQKAGQLGQTPMAASPPVKQGN
jgi:hypothetical protein